MKKLFGLSRREEVRRQYAPIVNIASCNLSVDLCSDFLNSKRTVQEPEPKQVDHRQIPTDPVFFKKH
jgi:hypothetical protein